MAKAKSLIFILIFLLSGVIYAEARLDQQKIPISDEFDFRGVRWGMSLGEVVKSETNDPFEIYDKILVYKVQLNNADFKLWYYFIHGQELSAASFILDQKYTNDNNYVQLYLQLSEQLTKKYGNPTLDEIKWSKALYKDKEEYLGHAYSLGHVETNKKWETPTTIITAAIAGENLDIFGGLDYESKKHFDEMEKLREDDALGSL